MHPTSTDLRPRTLAAAHAAIAERTAALAAQRTRLERRRQLLGYSISAVTVLFVALAATVLLHNASGWPTGLAALALISLIVLWQRLRRPLTRLDRLDLLYRDTLARMDATAPDTPRGADLHPGRHPYERDLNLLGEHSLFSYLPPARTEAGATALASLLLDPASHATILDRQHSVQELASRLDLRERITLLGPSARQTISATRLLAWARAPAQTLPRAASTTLLVLSIGVLLLLAAGLTHRLDWPLALSNLAVLAALQAGITYRLRHRVVQSLAAADHLAPELALLRKAVALLASTTAAAPQLTRLRAAVASHDAVTRPLARLDARLAIVDQRQQQWFVLASLLFSAGTQAAIALERWRAAHAPALVTALTAWADFDALNTLAAFAFEHPDFPWPTLDSGPVARLELTGLRHPLLPPAIAVPNTITLDAHTRFLLISGSNMSGKSTLLRAIGTAVVLAYAGAPVPCTAARLSRLRLCASINPADSLAEGRSRFLAEIQQLHTMLRSTPHTPANELTPDPPPTLFLIDEILGGTNSVDRHTAASSILRRLIAEGAVGALSTHDLALIPLAEDPALHGQNCHMGSPDPADPLRFDFLLRPGSNHLSSAPALLRLLGL